MDEKEPNQVGSKPKEIDKNNIPASALHLFEKRTPKPLYVRVNDYKRMYGSNYIIRRNEFGSAMYVVGKAYRKLSTRLDVDMALQQGRLVAQWGNKYFLYTTMNADDGRRLLTEIWEIEVKRGIPVPEVSDYDKANFDI
ncbi:hypothetical protein ACFLQJ_02320 [Calditrichota bacterium]